MLVIGWMIRLRSLLMFSVPLACSCEDRPCCDCGQEYLAEMRMFGNYGVDYYNEVDDYYDDIDSYDDDYLEW